MHPGRVHYLLYCLIINLLFLALLGCPGKCQEWIRYFGTGQNAEARYCIEDEDHGIIIAGRVQNGLFGWIIKTDINGLPLWDIKIGDGKHTISIRNIEKTNDHGLIISGSTRIFSNPFNAPYLIKINSCGETEWCRVVQVKREDQIDIRAKQTRDGGFIMATFCGVQSRNRIRLIRLDKQGTVLWSKIVFNPPGVFNEDIRSMEIFGDDFLMTGFCYTPDWISPYFIKTNHDGGIWWQLACNSHSGSTITGDAWQTVMDTRGNYYSIGSQEGCPALIKISGDGKEVYTNAILPEAVSGNGRTILLLHDTTLIVSIGWSRDGIINQKALVCTDTLGNIRSKRILPNQGHGSMHSSIKTHDNKIVIIGNDQHHNGTRIIMCKYNSGLDFDSVNGEKLKYDVFCPYPTHSRTIKPDCLITIL